MSASNEGSLEKLNALFSEMFTKQYIENDAFTSSNAQPNMSFTFDIICQAPQVREITTDEHIIADALTKCQNIEFVDKVIRPRLRVEQHIIILRDILSETPPENIIKIFETAAPLADGTPCPHALSVRADVNNIWYAYFATESDARNALLCVRSSRYEGNLVKARLKTESLNKVFYGSNDNRFGQLTPTGGSPPNQHVEYFGGPQIPIPGGMYFGYPGGSPNGMYPPPQGGPFPQPFSPMGMPNMGMWPMSGMVPMMGYAQQRQNKPGQNGNRNNNKQRSPRNNFTNGRNIGGFQPNDGPIVFPSGPEGISEGPATFESATATFGSVDENENVVVDHNAEDAQIGSLRYAGTPRRQNDGERYNNNRGYSNHDSVDANGQRRKTAGNNGVQNNNAQNARRKLGNDQRRGGDSDQKRLPRNNDNRRKTNTRPDAAESNQARPLPNFNLDAADFPSWASGADDRHTSDARGGDKGSWAAAVVGGNKRVSGSDESELLTALNKRNVKTDSADDHHHSILLNSSQNQRSHSFGNEVHISFVPEASDEPSHLHRVPTPVPSAEEVLERWSAESAGVTSPPPLHVNDSVQERHQHKIIPGTQVAQELETFMFGSFDAPIGKNTVEENTNANVHVNLVAPKPLHPQEPAAVESNNGGKRSFMDVLKAKK